MLKQVRFEFLIQDIIYFYKAEPYQELSIEIKSGFPLQNIISSDDQVFVLISKLRPNMMANQDINERIVFDCTMFQYASRRWKDYLIHVSLIIKDNEKEDIIANSNINLGYYLSNYSELIQDEILIESKTENEGYMRFELLFEQLNSSSFKSLIQQPQQVAQTAPEVRNIKTPESSKSKQQSKPSSNLRSRGIQQSQSFKDQNMNNFTQQYKDNKTYSQLNEEYKNKLQTRKVTRQNEIKKDLQQLDSKIQASITNDDSISQLTDKLQSLCSSFLEAYQNNQADQAIQFLTKEKEKLKSEILSLQSANKLLQTQIMQLENDFLESKLMQTEYEQKLKSYEKSMIMNKQDPNLVNQVQIYIDMIMTSLKNYQNNWNNVLGKWNRFNLKKRVYYKKINLLSSQFLRKMSRIENNQKYVQMSCDYNDQKESIKIDRMQITIKEKEEVINKAKEYIQQLEEKVKLTMPIDKKPEQSQTSFQDCISITRQLSRASFVLDRVDMNDQLEFLNAQIDYNESVISKLSTELELTGQKNQIQQVKYIPMISMKQKQIIEELNKQSTKWEKKLNKVLVDVEIIYGTEAKNNLLARIK